MTLCDVLRMLYGKELKDATDEQIYFAMLFLINNVGNKKRKAPDGRKLYYISAEFLIGRLMTNNLISIGMYESVKNELSQAGKDIDKISLLENEPSLGNGGLGRLAACFLDSIAALGLCGDGIGLLYHYGLFRQSFENLKQAEHPDNWLSDKSIITKTNTGYFVTVMGTKLKAVMYDINVYGKGSANTLHLFDLSTVNESLVNDGITFDKGKTDENLTLFLYPDDSDEQGRMLRICQQYFMVSAAAQLILDEVTKRGCKLYDLDKFAVIQINDTHPAMIIPELVRLLCERGLTFDKALLTVSRTCAYTNHTILSEALEKWHISMLQRCVPQLVPIIEAIDDKIRRAYSDDRLYIIDNTDTVHMASLAIHCGFCVNGVAKLHTEILKHSELSAFYSVYPGKFQNKTNGISFRRWLTLSNPELDRFIRNRIGSSFDENPEELKKLTKYLSDRNSLSELMQIKQLKKRQLCEFLKREQGIEINERSIFDIQIKRLHEYKRQQLNILYCLDKYLKIKSGILPTTPVTVIFGAKAAPAYTIAKDIIHLILCVSRLLEQDSEAGEYLRVVMVENYNVSLAQKLIPACDISQQISLASKEASGTGNMKLMLNGAVTVGTLDGANVEIAELVGQDNIYIFGDRSETVVKRYRDKSYDPNSYYRNNKRLSAALDFIVSPPLMSIGDKQSLERLYNELTTKDWFMTLPDFDSYVQARDKAYDCYEDKFVWAGKMLTNIANAGYFSSDRTIKEYNSDIWKL